VKIIKKIFFENYFNEFYKCLNDYKIKDFNNIIKLFIEIKENKKKIIFLGNGASASISSHLAVDLTKAANIKSINFNEPNLITCLANDFGHDNWMKQAIDFYADKGDLIIFISSSGQSKNIVNSAKHAKKRKFKIVTFSGFKRTNPLNKLGIVNMWVNSKSYNIIENTHQAWLLSLVDFVIQNNKKQ